MPDGPRYDDDFFAWTQYQAEVLRDLNTRDNRFDRKHLAEEIEDLGRSQRDAVLSQVERILTHFLKLAYSPALDPRLDWVDSIVEARSELEKKRSPSLRTETAERLVRLYALARKRASIQLQRYGEQQAARALPPECPHTLEQVLADDWYPDPAGNAAALESDA